MSRVVTTVLNSLIGKLPVGWVLALRGGVLDAILQAFATPLATAEADAQQLMDEVDPRLANRLLPDFERVLGPDPCGRDLGERTTEQRQRQAHQRWTARGGASVSYFVDVADRLGTEIAIEEFWPSRAGVLRAGQPLVEEGEQFTWRVRVVLIASWLFRAGRNVAGDPLGGFTLSDIECELRRLKPAHTQLVFAYVAVVNPPPPAAIALLGAGDGLAFDFTDDSYAMRATTIAEALLGDAHGMAFGLTDNSFAMRFLP